MGKIGTKQQRCWCHSHLGQNRLLISKSFSHFSVTVKKHPLQSYSLLVIFPVCRLRLCFKLFLACVRWTDVVKLQILRSSAVYETDFEWKTRWCTGRDMTALPLEDKISASLITESNNTCTPHVSMLVKCIVQGLLLAL